MTERLHIWVVYEKPIDYPEGYVARRFNVNQPTNDAFAHTDLERVRAWVQDQAPKYGGICYQMPRMPDDDPAILECWL